MNNDSIIRMNEIIKSIRRDDDTIRMSDEYLYDIMKENDKGDKNMERTAIGIGDMELYNQIKKAAEMNDTIIFRNCNDILMLEIKKHVDKSTSNQKNIVTNWMDDILDIIDKAGSSITDKDDALNRIESYCAAVKTCVTS